jgi:hypothetical protein
MPYDTPETTTATSPKGTPVSAPTTTVSAPPTAPVTGTGFTIGQTIEELRREPTYPTIYIATSLVSAMQNGISLKFDYLPESLSFGVSANFNQNEVPWTSARWITYDHSDIEEVGLTIKVVAGCNNCITYFSGNTKLSKYLTRGNLVSSKYERVSLITLAQILYSLPLPGSNPDANFANALPPPTCRLTVARMFSGPGAFTGCSIQFNGPYDYDGSPTDMDVSLRFLPSEFYDSSTWQTGQAQEHLTPVSTPSGATQLTANYPYALTFGDTQLGMQGKSEPGTKAPETPAEAAAKEEAARQARILRLALAQAKQYKVEEAAARQAKMPTFKGPTSPTPTEAEIALAWSDLGIAPTAPEDVSYDQPSDVYTINGRAYKGDYVRQTTQGWSAQQRALRQGY